MHYSCASTNTCALMHMFASVNEKHTRSFCLVLHSLTTTITKASNLNYSVASTFLHRK